MTFSSICNTTSPNTIIDLYNGKYNFQFCNFLNNKHTNSGSKTFLCEISATVLIETSSFLGNTGPGYEFKLDRSSLTVKDSFCDKIDKTYGSVNTNNVQNLCSIHYLSHFSTYLCEAGIHILCIKKNIITHYEEFYLSSSKLIFIFCINCLTE